MKKGRVPMARNPHGEYNFAKNYIRTVDKNLNDNIKGLHDYYEQFIKDYESCNGNIKYVYDKDENILYYTINK